MTNENALNIYSVETESEMIDLNTSLNMSCLPTTSGFIAHNKIQPIAV